jgi:zinc transport system substrate-binding protein
MIPMKSSMWRLRSTVPVIAVLAAGVLVGCGGGSGEGQRGAAGASGGSGSGLTVVTSFYPLQYATQRVLGSTGTATNLTKPGAEPHDLELTPKDVATVRQAKLVVYLKGLQPEVDQAVSSQALDRAFDVSDPADLSLTFTPVGEGESHESHESHSGEAGSRDPHFWLDPIRLAAVGDALAARLGKLDPGQASAFTANAAALHKDLQALDAEYRTGLKACACTDLVTSHNAFGYLAQRYGLTQIGISGLTPDQEPNATHLAEVAALVKTHHVRTIYYETLVSPKIAEAVAAETGARTAVLDPIEGLTDQSQGEDYLQVMRSNLKSIRSGQPCS